MRSMQCLQQQLPCAAYAAAVQLAAVMVSAARLAGQHRQRGQRLSSARLMQR
jgi:hypothetical protein